MHVYRSVLISLSLSLCATALAAQDEGKLGINLRVQRGAQIGLHWRASAGVTLRPSLVFDWVKLSSPFATIEATQCGLDLDVLFRAATWGGGTG